MRQLAYIMFITNNHASFHLWQKENWQLIKNIMSMIVVVSIIHLALQYLHFIDRMSHSIANKI